MITTLVMYVFILAVLVDGFFMWRGFKKVLAARMPDAPTRGLLMYGMNRCIQIRRFRMPPPRVKRGDDVLTSRDSAQRRSGPCSDCQTRTVGKARMEFRYLGNSGLKVSAISYGNWVTHGSQVEADQATACVRAALDAGITTFDTADVYANGKAETILGDALAGERRESLEIFTKVYFPTGPRGPNDTGLSRKHIHESINASLRRLRTDYVDLYQAHRYDHETPLEETMQAFADVVRAGKALYIGVSEWTPEQLRAGPRAGPGAADPARLQPAAVQRALPGDRGRGGADLPRAGHQPGRLLPHRAGHPDRQVQAGPAAARGLAGHRRGRRRRQVHQGPADRRTADPGAAAGAAGRGRGPDHGPARRGLGAAATTTSPPPSPAAPGRSR